MKIAFDGSSLLWTCLLAGDDKEGYTVEFNDKSVKINTAEYGYENAVNSIVSNMKLCNLTPKDIILIWEGMSSKASRLVINSTYKSKRGVRPPEAYAEFATLKERLSTVFGKLGALSVTNDNVEGDDTLGWFAENTEEDLVIWSRDNDISVLNKVNKYGATITVTINGVIGQNIYGDFPCQYITVYKALVGDTRDTISGIPGFGLGAFNEFMKEFGAKGLAELDRLAKLGSLDELVPEMDMSKMVARIVHGAPAFLNSYELARLHVEWVNTLDYPLQWSPGLIRGEVADERLMPYQGTTELVTAKTWDKFKSHALETIGTYNQWISLDIETSTPEESDEWIAAQGKREGVVTVDVIGSGLTGMSLTFGANMEQTVYIPINHIDTDNVPKDLLRDFIKELSDAGVKLVIHSCQFEGTVLYNEWGSHWKDNGCEGLLPHMLDTKIEASYVNENESLGLKKLAKMWFNYDQVDYKTVTTIDGMQHKMCELTGEHVQDYGCDDAIVAASLHNFFKLFMQLEHTWQIYLDVEIDAMYLHIQSFIHGVKCDIAKSRELEALDEQTSQTAWITLSKYLVEQGWDGTVPPTYSEMTPAAIKEAFLITTGAELVSRDRLLPKIAVAVEAQGSKLLAEMIRANDYAGMTTYVQSKFTAKPEFNVGSPKQLQKLLYETMALPVRVYNKPTDIARKAGVKQGSPKTDELAMTYALKLDVNDNQREVLESLRLIKMVQTRQGLYYSTYPYLINWKTGKLHSSHNQSATNTRRASSSGPNLMQLPKRAKLEGYAARFREVIVPHKSNALVISMDFVSQEILLLAEWSHDPVLESVFTGNPPRDMHSMTGVGIYNNQNPEEPLTYEEFVAIINDQHHEKHKTCKQYRFLGKQINFSGQYRVGAKKMATMLFVTEEEAQAMIDAKAEAFPVSEQWALDEMENVKYTGEVKSMLGAIRHLRTQVNSKDSYEASKADRQALSYRIQGSAGEMTKLAEGRMWQERLEQKFDCQIYFPVHDEVAASCTIDDLPGFIPAMHKCMTANYANMKLPIRSSISFGPDFYRQIEIGNEPTVEAIETGLVEYRKLKETI